MKRTDDHVFDLHADIEPTKEQDIIVWLRCENAYLRGVIEAYEKFLKDRNAKEDG